MKIYRIGFGGAGEPMTSLMNGLDHPNGLPGQFRPAQRLGTGRAAMSRDIAGIGIDDETTKQTIRQAHASFGYLMDPHTAVGYAALQRARSEGGWEAPAVVLSTAHPGKFREELGGILDLEIPVPVDLEALKERPVRSLPLAVREEAFREFLLGW